MTGVLLISALLIGCLLAVQASVNLQLNKAVGTPYGASTLQLWFAVVLLAVLAAPTGAFGALAGIADVPAWYLLGGLASPSTSPAASCSSRAWARSPRAGCS